MIRGMDFHESHVQHRPLRVRDLVDYSPITEGIRYVRSDARLIATMVAKTGIGIMGANWVIFPLLGEKVFPLTGHGLAPSRGGMLSMSLLMAARGVGSVMGPIASAAWAGQNQGRLRVLIMAGGTAWGGGRLPPGGGPEPGGCV